VPDVVDLVTIDVSYPALLSAAPQLERVRLAPDVEAIALVKPQFELGLASPPEDGQSARRLCDAPSADSPKPARTSRRRWSRPSAARTGRSSSCSTP